MVQGLRICLTIQGMWVQSLVRELKSHMPWSNRAHVPQLRPDVVKGKKKISPDLCALLVCSQFLSTLFAPLNFVMEKVESILPSSLWHQLTRI